ncbi:MAG: zinc-dependent peptidase [Candidatus Melainabacteria bacterium]
MADNSDERDLVGFEPDELPGEACEGFIFRYFVPGEAGETLEVDASEGPHFSETEEKIFQRIRSVLVNRQDLLGLLGCLPNGLEIHLYQTTGRVGFRDHENEIYFFGRTTNDGDSTIMEFATDEVLHGGTGDHDVLDVVVHEMVHVLDFFNGYDEEGLLPGLSGIQRERFEAERLEEMKKIITGQSPLDKYALRDHAEFLAVLVETFFVKPVPLRHSNPVLYELLTEYFRLDPASTHIA